MPGNRKNSTWYKIWNLAFRISLWYFAGFIILLLLGQVIDGVNNISFPYSLLLIVMFPALLISFVALWIMRENDREKERMAQYNDQTKKETDNPTS